MKEDVCNAFEILSKDGKYLCENATGDYYITDLGIKVVERAKANIAEEEKEKSQDKKKKWYDSENARLAFEDYPRVKKQSQIAIAVSVITVVITVLLELLKK